MKNKKTDGFFHTVCGELILGIVLSGGLLLAGLFLGALALGLTQNPVGLFPPVAIGIFTAVGFLSGLFTRSKRGIVSRLPSLLFVLLLLLIGLCLTGGKLPFTVLIGDALFLIAAFLGGIIPMEKRKRKKKKR